MGKSDHQLPMPIGFSGYPADTGCVFPVPTKWKVKQSLVWSDMTIKDEWDNEVFKADAKFFTIGHELHFVDYRIGAEVGYLKQKFRCFGMPKYDIFIGNQKYAVVKQEFNCCHNEFSIKRTNGERILVKGDWTGHSYEFHNKGKIIAFVEKKVLTIRDTYTVHVMPGQNVVFILACCIIIDKCTTKD